MQLAFDTQATQTPALLSQAGGAQYTSPRWSASTGRKRHRLTGGVPTAIGVGRAGTAGVERHALHTGVPAESALPLHPTQAPVPTLQTAVSRRTC